MTDYVRRVRDHARTPLSLLEQELVIRWLAPAPPRRILDIAAGPGVVLRRLCECLGAGGVAVDADPEMGVHTACAESLPFDDATFGHALFHHALGHVDDPPLALSEIHRVLRHGGTLSLIATNRWYKLCRAPANLWTGYRPDPRDHRTFTRHQVFALLRAAGFQILRWQFLGPRAFPCGPQLRLIILARRERPPWRSANRAAPVTCAERHGGRSLPRPFPPDP